MNLILINFNLIVIKCKKKSFKSTTKMNKNKIKYIIKLKNKDLIHVNKTIIRK